MDTKHGDFKYFTQLSIETPRVVRHLFPLNEDPKHNYIAGFSMGGYGTMKWMLRDPEQFAFGTFSGNKNAIDFVPEVEDNTELLYVRQRVRQEVQCREHALISYMIKQQKAAGKRFPKGYMATGVEDTHYEGNVEYMDKYEAGPGI